MRRISLHERPDWREQARSVGFGFHEMYGEPYWVDDAAYVFGFDQIEEHIEGPSQELHEMCMDLVADVIESEETLEKLRIPEEMRDTVRQSWRRGDRHLYGRFDLAYTGEGPAKLLEYNADTPTSIFESAYFQYDWLTDRIDAGVLPEGADQFNSLQENLIEAFGHFPTTSIFHFSALLDNEEDRGTTTYLMDCAMQAGHQVELIDIRDIGVDRAGRFTDLKDRLIERCFKLYPWEVMFKEPFAAHLRHASGIFVEPMWKSILSNKGILPLLWERHRGHPNLLESYFAGDCEAQSLADYVKKPLFSREGESISLFEGQRLVAENPGIYGAEGYVIQAMTPLFDVDNVHAILGSWIVGDAACGLSIREDESRITTNLSRFVPHVIVD
ncbi:glutathionylspermidine synthase family protein [uncultured Agrobacterium sp.]|uniref:glutathionylspermidine synthase family protein n=1 Tax=uncultured Agrobacterium sp. TaxID=157277 RepID=UPI0025D978CF|nr:glutathionylspermidine synthase family protein [uncultured Agrobacterium sp.]